MPLLYTRDDVSRRIQITLVSRVTVDELVGSVERQFAERAWDYGVLADARAMSPALPPNEVRELVSRVQELIAARGPRGPIAFVAKQSEVIAAAQIYLLLGAERDSLEVFWDADEAQQWLNERLGSH